jgi:hypothetical protein
VSPYFSRSAFAPSARPSASSASAVTRALSLVHPWFRLEAASWVATANCAEPPRRARSAVATGARSGLHTAASANGRGRAISRRWYPREIAQWSKDGRRKPISHVAKDLDLGGSTIEKVRSRQMAHHVSTRGTSSPLKASGERPSATAERPCETDQEATEVDLGEAR